MCREVGNIWEELEKGKQYDQNISSKMNIFKNIIDFFLMIYFINLCMAEIK